MEQIPRLGAGCGQQGACTTEAEPECEANLGYTVKGPRSDKGAETMNHCKLSETNVAGMTAKMNSQDRQGGTHL